jgi:hypothetical protein
MSRFSFVSFVVTSFLKASTTKDTKVHKEQKSNFYGNCQIEDRRFGRGG